MTGTGWERLDQIGRGMLPALIVLLLVLIGVVPLPLPRFGQVAPTLTLIPVYYWSLHRPNLLPPGVVFGLGLLQDLLSGSAIGVTALIFVVVQWVGRTQGRFVVGKPFILLWWGFLLVAFTAAIAEWLVFCLLNLVLTPIQPAILRACIAIALFPLFAALLMRVDRATMVAE